MDGLSARRLRISRVATLAGGITCTGLGIAGMLRAHFGTDPFDAINASVGRITGLSVGVASWLNVGLVLALAWILGRRPRVGTVVVGLGIGLVINLGLALLPVQHGIVVRAVLAAASLAVLYLGVTGYVISDLGAGALEELMLALVARGAKLRSARWGIEAVLLAVAFGLRGPIGIVTVAFVLLTGPVLAWTIPFLARLVRLPLPHHDPNVPLGDIR